LWRSQSGDTCWEGRLGGIRRPDVRIAAYQALIEAETTTRVHGVFVPGLVLDDIDCDGRKEILYQAADFNSYVHERGACVFELDSFKTRHNFCSVYSVEGKTGLRNSFVDAICPFGDFGNSIIDLTSSVFSLEKVDKSVQKVTFGKDIPTIKLSIRKSYLFQRHCISVDYEIVNHGSSESVFRFVTTLNLQLGENIEESEFTVGRGHESWNYTDDHADEKEQSPDNSCRSADSIRIECQQTKNAIELRSDSTFAFKVRHHFDEFSTADLERLMENPLPEVLYQGTEMTFGWDLEMPPDATRNISLSLHLAS
jgi:hypothetical protein